MDYIYVFIDDQGIWEEDEDIIVFLSKEEALRASKRHPTVRIEVFAQSPKGGYRPTYAYFLDGKYCKTILHGVYNADQ